MRFRKMKTFGSVIFSGLLLSGLGLLPLAASASPRAGQGTLLSLHQRVNKTFTCDGEFVVSIEENASGYSYRAVNVRGDDLVIDGGTAHTGRNYAIIYVFAYEGTDYVLEDYGNRQADLSVGAYPQQKVNYSCTEETLPR